MLSYNHLNPCLHQAWGVIIIPELFYYTFFFSLSWKWYGFIHLSFQNNIPSTDISGSYWKQCNFIIWTFITSIICMLYINFQDCCAWNTWCSKHSELYILYKSASLACKSVLSLNPSFCIWGWNKGVEDRVEVLRINKL